MSNKIRNKKTIELIKKYIAKGSLIYDMGHKSGMTNIIKKQGYSVMNNQLNNDIDHDQSEIIELSSIADITTSFEVLEHLVNPYEVLKSVNTNYMLITVPLNLWFRKSYWNYKDKFDRHYHEFEPRQFEMLLEKTGWQILDSGLLKIWHGIGVRPLIRRFIPSYMFVYAKKITA